MRLHAQAHAYASRARGWRGLCNGSPGAVEVKETGASADWTAGARGLGKRRVGSACV